MERIVPVNGSEQPIELEVDYQLHTIVAARGVSDGTILRLREYDENNGYVVRLFEVKSGSPVFTDERVECRCCGGNGTEFECENACPVCKGTGLEP